MAKTLDKEGLGEESNLKERYEEKYKDLFKEHDRLGKIVHQDLEKLLEDANIDVLSVNHRTKDFDKFLEKIRRKKYKDPLTEIEDICGLRIICYYTSDLDKITLLIKREFDVINSVNKFKLLGEDEFGYLSRHFIVKLKKSWLNTPSYRDLGHLKVEIQLRTVLMHAWADISHQIAYKRREQAPPQFMRQLNSLSAILENADAQFDALRADRENYMGKMSEKAVKSGSFDLNQELNLDSLQAFIDYYFSDRKRDINNTSILLDEIVEYNKIAEKSISFKSFVDKYEKYKDNLAIEDIVSFELMERENAEELRSKEPIKFREFSKNNKYLTQTGAARYFLKEYFEGYYDLIKRVYWK